MTSLPLAFARWEQALATATIGGQVSLADLDHTQTGTSSQKWREDIAKAPVLDITPLEQDPALLRRAHHVLAFLVHFYVHSTPPDPSTTSILIPKSLAVPLVNVSQKLAIAPVLTFADTVLWNHEIIDHSLPLTRANIRPLTLFTGGPDEANFYGCCAEIELRGVEALRAIASFYDMVSGPGGKGEGNGEKDDEGNDADIDEEYILEQAAECLKIVAGVIHDLSAILQSVREICDPHAFYFAVRPWFRGSDAAGPTQQAHWSQPRWVYEGVSESEHQKLELSGPSAGQSSIIHTLDIFLDVDHQNSGHQTEEDDKSSTPLAPSACPHAKLASTSQNSISSSSSPTSRCPQAATLATATTATVNLKLPNGEFMTRMRRYMPGSHQTFLEQLTAYTHTESQRRSIRQLASRHPDRLMGPYNEAVLALKHFRDLHIRIACLYVVSMSRKANGVPLHGGGANTGMPSMCPAMRQRQRQLEPVRGTGGNELSLLLKSCRDATSRTVLQAN